jgi:hypothetical protein
MSTHLDHKQMDKTAKFCTYYMQVIVLKHDRQFMGLSQSY